jgi:hypothetical protein
MSAYMCPKLYKLQQTRYLHYVRSGFLPHLYIHMPNLPSRLYCLLISHFLFELFCRLFFGWFHLSSLLSSLYDVYIADKLFELCYWLYSLCSSLSSYMLLKLC